MLCLSDAIFAFSLLGLINAEETSLSREDFERAKQLTTDPVTPDVGILSKAGKFEGDIANLTPDTLQAFLRKHNTQNRNAVLDRRLLWPDGQIPYTISASYTQYEKSVIAAAIAEYHEKTCLRFVPRTEQADYVAIEIGQGCSSMLGRIGGRQPVSLGNGCVYKGIVEHELMHAVGFLHEQSRTDRDNYVNIHWGNIMDGLDTQFQKYDLNFIQLLNTQYDYNSVMHYGALSFSKNGQPTITPKQPEITIGQRSGLSSTDVVKLNRLYNCKIDEAAAKPTMPPCLDNAASSWMCSFWAKAGLCVSALAKSYLERNCARSCGVCV